MNRVSLCYTCACKSLSHKIVGYWFLESNFSGGLNSELFHSKKWSEKVLWTTTKKWNQLELDFLNVRIWIFLIFKCSVFKLPLYSQTLTIFSANVGPLWSGHGPAYQQVDNLRTERVPRRAVHLSHVLHTSRGPQLLQRGVLPTPRVGGSTPQKIGHYHSVPSTYFSNCQKEKGKNL